MTDDPWRDAPVLAAVTRSGFVEGHHRGAVVAVAADGAVTLARGPIDVAVYGRSANKPMQAVAVVRAGAPLDAEGVALATASHSGEPAHLAVVGRVLAAAGLDEAALANTPGLPLHPDAAAAVLAAGSAARPLTQNCSGKHAAMLAACVANGWPVEGYLDADHPVQRVVTTTIADLAGEPVGFVGVDGCGAPAHAVSLHGLARAFARLARADPATPEGRVAVAMRAHPYLVGGTERDVTRLMEAIPGLVAKDGAEGVFAAAMPDGRAVAVKIDDGGGRARTPVLISALAALGVDVDGVADLATTPVLGGGRRVGAVTAVGFA